jgi:glutamine amidotransferase
MSSALVVDYGVGNLLSVRRALEWIGAEVELSGDPDRIRKGGPTILPGVGAFGDCIGELRSRGLVDPLRDHVAAGRPLIGICVGMQMLFEASEEFGEHEGLGIFKGRVVRIPSTGEDGRPHKVPHVAWSPLVAGERAPHWEDTVLAGIEEGAHCYFVHSYAPEPIDPELRLADALYDGRRLAAVVGRGSVVGCQFHPEKSAAVGLRILATFLSRAARR